MVIICDTDTLCSGRIYLMYFMIALIRLYLIVFNVFYSIFYYTLKYSGVVSMHPNCSLASGNTRTLNVGVILRCDLVVFLLRLHSI